MRGWRVRKRCDYVAANFHVDARDTQRVMGLPKLSINEKTALSNEKGR